MFMDNILYNGVIEVVAEQTMLQDLEHCFWNSNSSSDKFGFPITDGVPTELEEAVSLWMSLDKQTRQGQLLGSLNITHQNNDEQQKTFDLIMD